MNYKDTHLVDKLMSIREELWGEVKINDRN
jgi:hypothetical protein